MTGRTVIAPNATTRPSGPGRALEAVSDVVIVTAVVWAPILMAGGLWALVRMFL